MKSNEPEAVAAEENTAPVLVGDATSKRRLWPWIAGAAAAAVLLYVLLARGGKPASGAKAGAKGGPQRSIPVTAIAARSGDLGVYLTGLGTVTPVSTVTVRSRVDGQLIDVAFQEGQLVKTGDLLAEIDPRPFQVQLMQAEGQTAKDEAALKNAHLDLERLQALLQDGLVSKQQVDTQVATVQQIEASLKTDRSQIESARLNLVYSRVTAPISGRVGLRLVDPGNIVHASDASGLVVITQLQPIAVVFTVAGDQLPSVLPQMRAGKKLTVEAYDRDLKNRLAVGSLLAVDNQIDQATGTVRLKALFANDALSLFPNQFVNARLLVDTLKDTVLVPAAAVQRSPQGTFVYVVRPDETAELRNVEVRLTEGENSAIGSGLAAGDLVVVDGIDKLQPGSKVSVGRADAKGGKKAAA